MGWGGVVVEPGGGGLARPRHIIHSQQLHACGTLVCTAPHALELLVSRLNDVEEVALHVHQDGVQGGYAHVREFASGLFG